MEINNNVMFRRVAWLILLLTVAVVFTMVFIPFWLIQPFKPQTTRGVEISYMLRSLSPVLTIVFSILAFIIIGLLWRGARSWWRRGVMVIALVFTLALTWFARQNHFEWMFNPLPNSAYATANEASFVADSNMVMSVEKNGETVAYPITQMAYHHIVQDVVGGVPIVATY